MKSKFFIFFIIFILNKNNLNAHPDKEEPEQFFKCLSFHKQDLSNKLETHFKALNKNIVGKELLRRLIVQLKGKKINVKPTKDGHCFYAENGVLNLDINTDNIKYTIVGFPKYPSVKLRHNNYYQIGHMAYPFHFVLGHELIHVLHYLENLAKYTRLKSAVTEKIKLDCDETKYHNRLRRLWQNSEEKRTVVGSDDQKSLLITTQDGKIDLLKSNLNAINICEALLLIAEEYPPRYAYHQKKKDFYEDEAQIESIFSENAVRLSKEHKIDFFDIDAKTSNLNSFTYQNTHKELYEEETRKQEQEAKEISQIDISNQSTNKERLERARKRFEALRKKRLSREDNSKK